MREFGRIAHVTRVQLGDELAEAAEATDTTITVVDAADFDEDGGTLTIGDEEIVYLSADDETGVITLAEGLANAYEEGERVLLDGYEYQAGVVLGLDDEMITARVPSDMVDSQALAEGERDAVRESVLLENEHEEWRIVEVLGVDLVRDGSYIDGDTLPAPPLSDGEPPEASPEPTLVPLPGGFLVKWTGISNADPVTYQVHISTTSGFTADSSTRIADTPGVMIAIFSLPDGTPLDPETTYYVRTIAYDEDGAAEQSAAASDEPGPTVTAEDLAAIEEAVGEAVEAASAAQEAAEGAHELAGSKRRVFFQDDPPADDDLDEGDLWFDTNNGNAIHRWDGDSWEQAALDTPAIANGAITQVKVANNAITAGKIAANAVEAGKIAANAVTANEIAADSVTASELAAGAVVAGKIGADAVEAGNIAAGAVQAGNIAAEAVTAENIAALSILSQHITAEAISAEHIAAATIDAAHLAAEIVLASLIRTAESGRRIEISNAGLDAFDSDDSSLLSIPTDGTASILNMDVVAKSLLAQSGAILRGTSRLTKGSTLELESATERPMVAPAVSVVWPSLELEPTPFDARGLYWDSSTSTWWTTRGKSNEVVQYDTDGQTVQVYSLENESGQAVYGTGGITKIGSTWYVLGQVSGLGQYRVYRYTSLDENAAGSWAYTDEPSGKRPAIGNDGTNILIARTAPNDDGLIKIRAYNPSTGATGSSVHIERPAGAPLNVDIAGVAYGSFDMGSDRYVVAYNSTGAIRPDALVANTSGTITNETFPLANKAAVQGLAWDGSQFWSLSDAGKLHRYTTNTWTTQSSEWWVAYSLRDGDSTGGTHETPLSPKQWTAMSRRAALRWTVPAIPDSGGTDDPDRVRIWIGRGTTEPADSAMWLNDEPDPGEVTGVIEAGTFSGTPFSTGKGTDFTDTTPAEVRTVDGIPLFRANGFPRVKLGRSTTTSILGGTDTSVTWEFEDVDTDDMWPGGTNVRIAIPFSGNWLITAEASFAANGTGYRRIWIEGSDDASTWELLPALQDSRAGFTGTANFLSFSQVALVNQNYLRLRVFQNSGGALNLNQARISLVYMGPA